LSDLLIERHGLVLTLTLARERVRNALGSALVAALSRAIEDADQDDSVRALVLRGGGSGFCAGSDLRELAGMSANDMGVHERRTAELTRRIAGCSRPVVAAVEGFAIGGGFFLAAACDVVVSGAGARWQLPEVELGWVPPWGLQLLAARVGPVTARRLCWGIDPLNAADAVRLGVADLVMEDGHAHEEADRIATRLASMPPSGVASTKRAFRGLIMRDAEAMDEDAAERFVADVGSHEAQASIDRFRPARG
jgi:enoyl-CoA hydratase/carnithine racemase